MKTILYTSFALVAFAFNSILCRLALQTDEIDWASFTLVRLVSGAITLIAIYLSFNKKREDVKRGSWFSAFFLFAYAVCFSCAYINLTTGTGALVLFGSVQATMILWGWLRGERLRARQLLGLLLALGGLVALIFPGLSAPPLFGSVLMLGAGFAWGIYSLRGKTTADPASATTGNFIRAVPFAVVLAVTFSPWMNASAAGVSYAIVSGAITSGLGYVIWYAVLPTLQAASAATVQLSVPVLTALGGILLLGEPLTFRFVVASIAILGGIALVVLQRRS